MEAATQDAPRFRYCDLVMKGGITSGVVYPKAIAKLSRHYRFKSIGGTSAGAIAAAVTAAAEYQRRKNDSQAGFLLLEALPRKLQEDVSPPWRQWLQRTFKLSKRSRLLSLFQPEPVARRLFSVLIGSLNAGGTWRRVGAIALGLLRAYWPVTLAVLAGALAVHGYALSWAAALPWLLVALVAGIGLWVYRDLTHGLVDNRFGMCSGMGEQRGNKALTPWLHEQIQTAAGLPLDGDPLTFGDLWTAPGFPPPWLEQAPGQPIRSIDLQMFSTNLGHGRPYIFPLRGKSKTPSRFRDEERLYFRPDELKLYLPSEVLAWMEAHSAEYSVAPGREGSDPPPEPGLRELPEPEHFPVLLAARMSLSFPLLFSAVPLWAVDHNPPRGKRKFRRCWFSDGGISSNFPMHLFDGLVPAWPTFGINLEAKIEDRDMVYLPAGYEEGHGEYWFGIDERGGPASRFGGFLGSIANATQNWNDNTLSRMPGVRDRIARVRLTPLEGGMNLDMSDERIRDVSERGARAAEALVQRFTAMNPDGPQTQGWDEQRFVRLAVLLKMIEARGAGVLGALSPNCGHVTDFKTLIERATRQPGQADVPLPPGCEEPLTPGQQAALYAMLDALGQLVALPLDSLDRFSFKPIPHPELRVRPAL